MNTADSAQFIFPDWPAPVRAVMTTRHGGISPAPYHRLNLGLNSGDDPDHVQENRRRLHRALNLPAPPAWLQQSHSIRVIPAREAAQDNRADGSYSGEAGVVCTVLTADCMPVLLCDTAGTCVAAVHAGWRGLAGGILEAAVAALPVKTETLLAWLGPAIGPRAFEVGPEVRAAFMAEDAAATAAFTPNRPGHYLCDLYHLARQRLARAGVSRVYGGGFCTYSDAARFYSYRRDQQTTGRMAALIWLEG